MAERLRLLRSKLKIGDDKDGQGFRKILSRFRVKQRLVVMDAATYREHWSFQLSALNLFVGIGILGIVMMVLTFLLIAFTPLHSLIPGYTNNDILEVTYHNMSALDSIDIKLKEQEQMMTILQSVVSGEDMPSIVSDEEQPKVSGEPDSRCRADSLLRDEMKNQQLAAASSAQPPNPSTNTFTQLFFPPIKGKIISQFDVKKGHFGVDIASNTNEIIKAAGNGTVSFSGFSVDDGYVLVIQHPGNAVSIYKHNSALLKHEGDMVRAGEPIAYLGNTGNHKTGPHLHFELWINGKAVNPLQYVSF